MMTGEPEEINAVFSREVINDCIIKPDSEDELKEGDVLLIKEYKSQSDEVPTFNVNYVIIKDKASANEWLKKINDGKVKIFTSSIQMDGRPNRNGDAFTKDTKIELEDKYGVCSSIHRRPVR